VIHLAAISFVPHGSPAEIYDVNTVGATNLLDALPRCPR
jgi:nucleoside-diphosphate-sugar epimerase